MSDTYEIKRRTLMQKLFPARHLSAPEETQGMAEGYLQTDAVCVFDWVDRLRLLISGKLLTQTKTQTDVHVSKARSSSNFYVLPPSAKVRRE